MDEYDDEDEVLIDAPAIPAAEAEAQANARSQQVRNLLSRGNVAEAIQVALENPPFGKDHTNAKATNVQTVMQVLLAPKSSDIGALVDSLSSDQQDVLLKYIYKGLSCPESFNSSSLLSWHEKTVQVAGLGAIARVLTDKRLV